MAGMERIKIQKKEYRFDIRKKYQNVKSYRIISETASDRIKKFFKGFFEKKPSAQKVKKKVPMAKEPSPGFNVALAGAAIGLGLLIVIIVWVYLTLHSIQGPPTQPPLLERPTIESTVLDGAVLTFGDRYDGLHAASIHLNYSSENVDYLTASITTYEKALPSEVFVLESARKEAESYPDFIRHLRFLLSKKNIQINDIAIEDLEDMPSGAVVLVPSGYVPKELLGSGTKITPDTLASKGIVIIYIGHSFDRMLDGERVSTTPQSLYANIPFNFNERASLTPSGISFYEPRYSVSGGSGGWSATVAYGAISILSKKDGAFVFVPQTLDGGWRVNPLNPEKPAYEYAAEDIAKIVVEMPWAAADGPSREVILPPGSGQVHLFSNPYRGTERSVVVNLAGIKLINTTDKVGGNITIEDRKIVHVRKAQSGELYTSGGAAIVSSSISELPVRMYGHLAEPSSTQVDMFFVIRNASGDEVLRVPRGRVNTQEKMTMDVEINLPKGEYTAALVDESNKVYASSCLFVSSIEVSYRGHSASTYRFSLSMNGVPYSLEIIRVSVDDGKFGRYEFHDTSEVNVDVGRYTNGDALPPGNHTFTFEIGGLKENVFVTSEVPVPPIFRDPLFVSAIILSALIAGAGILFSRREEVYFSIDIPDFPLTAREKVPISSDVILSIFEKVNSNYKWSYTPLRLAEIKSGFKDIFYSGKPIYITDYNVEFLLEKLKSKGKVKEAMGYYGPSYWEERTGKNMTTLALMRSLRDICINNAVPFTPLSESKKADSEIDVMGQKMFVHFYDPSVDAGGLFRRVLSTVSEGITIVLSKDDFDRGKFRSYLDSPTVASLLLKLEVENSSILLLTVSELEKMIRELKIV
ncbi:MAG: hypothetical protein QW171_02900 [Candidatus Bilamarchaeaceae archaeon]